MIQWIKNDYKSYLIMIVRRMDFYSSLINPKRMGLVFNQMRLLYI